MHADIRSVLFLRSQDDASPHAAPRWRARRRAVGTAGAVALIFALTSAGAWAAGPTGVESPSTETPSESPSSSPEPTPSPTPSPSESPAPTPSPSGDAPPVEDPEDEEDSHDGDDQDSDDEDDQDSDDENESDDESRSDESPTGDETGSGTPSRAEPSAVIGSPVMFNSENNELEFGRFLPSALAALEDPGPLEADFEFIVTPRSLTVGFYDVSTCGSEGEWEVEG